MSKDTPEIQIEKLVLTDLLHGSQLGEASSSLIHPWSLDLIRNRLATLKMPNKLSQSRLSHPERYNEELVRQTTHLAQIYQNLIK